MPMYIMLCQQPLHVYWNTCIYMLAEEFVVDVWGACKQKLYGNDSCPSELQLTGIEGQMDGKLCSSGEGGTESKDLPRIYVCVAPPMIVGTWSMAVELWQPEYVYVYNIL